MKVFCNCKEEKAEMLKSFQETLLTVVASMEKTQNKFVEVAGKIEIEHFKMLDKQMDKQGKLFSEVTDKFLKSMEQKPKIEKALIQEFEEKISRIKPEEEENTIEKVETEKPPFEEFIPPDGLKNVQFEGQEEIYPIS